MASHKNVKIKITVLENEAFKQKLTTNMQAGKPPDIFHSWGGGVLKEQADAGLVKDITKDSSPRGSATSPKPRPVCTRSTASSTASPSTSGIVGCLVQQVAVQEGRDRCSSRHLG